MSLTFQSGSKLSPIAKLIGGTYNGKTVSLNKNMQVSMEYKKDETYGEMIFFVCYNNCYLSKFWVTNFFSLVIK